MYTVSCPWRFNPQPNSLDSGPLARRNTREGCLLGSVHQLGHACNCSCNASGPNMRSASRHHWPATVSQSSASPHRERRRRRRRHAARTTRRRSPAAGAALIGPLAVWRTGCSFLDGGPDAQPEALPGAVDTLAPPPSPPPPNRLNCMIGRGSVDASLFNSHNSHVCALPREHVGSARCSCAVMLDLARPQFRGHHCHCAIAPTPITAIKGDRLFPAHHPGTHREAHPGWAPGGGDGALKCKSHVAGGRDPG